MKLLFFFAFKVVRGDFYIGYLSEKEKKSDRFSLSFKWLLDFYQFENPSFLIF